MLKLDQFQDRSNKPILDSLGTPIGIIREGDPTDRTIMRNFVDTMYGPFTDQSAAQICLDAELAKIRAADPKRFDIWDIPPGRLGSSLPGLDANNYRQDILCDRAARESYLGLILFLF